MSGAASAFAGRGRSERPIFRTKLALGSPNLSCLSPVCWLFRLRSVEPPPMQDACLSCHRCQTEPSCALPVRQRGFYQCPRALAVPCHLLHHSSCPTITSATPSSSTHSSNRGTLRASSLRPFTTLPISYPTRRPVDPLSHPHLHLRSRARLHRRNLVD